MESKPHNVVNLVGVFLFGLVLFTIFSVIFAVANSISERSINGNSGCIYKNYVTKYNPQYRAVCELFRDRTLSNK